MTQQLPPIINNAYVTTEFIVTFALLILGTFVMVFAILLAGPKNDKKD